MLEETASAVDTYFVDRLIPSDPALDAALLDSEQAGLPPHSVSPTQGAFLNLIARLSGARRVLEIGTLGGYSTIWLARAVAPAGKVITLEVDENHARVAEQNIARAGLGAMVEIRVGKASELLAVIAGEHSDPFDLVFIDADKPNNPVYLDWALKLSRPGTVIIADNVVRDGAVADAESDDPNVKGVRCFIDLVAGDSRLSATALQTVGIKGHDGFMLALVNG